MKVSLRKVVTCIATTALVVGSAVFVTQSATASTVSQGDAVAVTVGSNVPQERPQGGWVDSYRAIAGVVGTQPPAGYVRWKSDFYSRQTCLNYGSWMMWQSTYSIAGYWCTSTGQPPDGRYWLFVRWSCTDRAAAASATGSPFRLEWGLAA